LFLLALVAIAVANVGASYSYSRRIEEKNTRIVDLSAEIKEKIKPEITEEKKEAVDYISASSCTGCHDTSSLRTFHNPESITNISRAKNAQPRLCDYCHGSRRAMVVHFNGIKEKRIKCEACHIRGSSGFIVPEKKEGMLLVCETCHAQGNYIKIHIDGDILEGAAIDEKWVRRREPKNCILCHNEELYGMSITELHKLKTAKAGSAEELPSIQKEKAKESAAMPNEIEMKKIWEKIAGSNSVVHLH